MERYLIAADYAMRQAMSAAFERPVKSVRNIYARDAIGARYMPRENGTLPDRLMFPVLDSRAQPEVRAGRAPNSSPETREREAVGKVSSIFSDAGQYGWGFNAPVAGALQHPAEGLLGLVSGGGIGLGLRGGDQKRRPTGTIWHRPNADEMAAAVTLLIYARVQEGAARRCLGLHAEAVRWRDRCNSRAASIRPTRCGSSARASAAAPSDVNPLATKQGMPGYAV
jgi:hypothetical protein